MIALRDKVGQSTCRVSLQKEYVVRLDAILTDNNLVWNHNENRTVAAMNKFLK